ncbi:ATP-binding protein [Psychrobium sp. nBUS_13]|uniref:ATP-binding protein n=1 Tax=Psychrobium sp. nBUS_13 TaxID=3395319 RepID=UPI003EBFD41A
MFGVSTRQSLIVIDGGQGMSEQQLQQALLPFYTTKHQGSGLGLALCNDIVIAHAGKLTISNLYQDGQISGLQVAISLPISSKAEENR